MEYGIYVLLSFLIFELLISNANVNSVLLFTEVHMWGNFCQLVRICVATNAYEKYVWSDARLVTSLIHTHSTFQL